MLAKRLRNQSFCSIFSQNVRRFSESVRVRYAPSPTGNMHIGGLRTVLFNYLYAKKHGGQFIVRIEDTDQNRNVEGSVENIFQTLSWLGIREDESIRHPNSEYGPYIQSERMATYKNIERALLKGNLAYPCFCQHEISDQNSDEKVPSNSKAKKKRESGEVKKYDGKCRKLTMGQIKEKIKNKEKYAVRIKGDLTEMPTHFMDLNYGMVKNSEFDDFVIVKSDGWPTFHLANVVDDWKMRITHVLRGQEWISNTSKHIYLYHVLQAPVPRFMHLPLIQSMGGKKLAKRDPDSSIERMKAEYEPQAVKNFVARLGWNPKEVPPKQGYGTLSLLSQSQMIQSFKEEEFMQSPAKFDSKILNAYNRIAIKKEWKEFRRLEKEKEGCQQILGKVKNKVQLYIPQSKGLEQNKLIEFWNLVHDRISVYSDIASYSYIIKQSEPNYGEEKAQKDLKSLFGPEAQILNGKLQKTSPDLKIKAGKIVQHLSKVFEEAASPAQFCEQKMGQKISEYLFSNREVSNEELFHLLRFIITGRKSGPSILKVVEIKGRQFSLKVFSKFNDLLSD